MGERIPRGSRDRSVAAGIEVTTVMATLASTAAVAPGAAAFDRIFSETATVVTELGEMAQKVIETEAAAAPREQSWFDEPDLDALKKLTGHTLTF